MSKFCNVKTLFALALYTIAITFVVNAQSSSTTSSVNSFLTPISFSFSSVETETITTSETSNSTVTITVTSSNTTSLLTTTPSPLVNSTTTSSSSDTSITSTAPILTSQSASRDSAIGQTSFEISTNLLISTFTCLTIMAIGGIAIL